MNATEVDIETTWRRIADASEFESRMRNVRAGEWSLDWRHTGTRLWHKAAQGSLDYLAGYVDGRIDGEAL